MGSRNAKIPYVQGGMLYKFDGTPVCRVGSRTGWLDWLNNEAHRSFHFESLAGMSCTLVKEKRKGSAGQVHRYWYAHKRIDNKLRRRYVGKAERMILARLEQAAIAMSQLELLGL